MSEIIPREFMEHNKISCEKCGSAETVLRHRGPISETTRGAWPTGVDMEHLEVECYDCSFIWPMKCKPPPHSTKPPGLTIVEK